MQRGCSPPTKPIDTKATGHGLAKALSRSSKTAGQGFTNGHANGAGDDAGNGNAHAHANGNGNGSGHHVTRNVFGHGAATRPGDVARDLISALWERSVPLITNRLNGLDIACEAAVIGRLSPMMRRGAADTAHKLAGSLGMFGYPRGTELAREIEQLLENDGVVDPITLRELVVELRACLPL